MLHLVFEATHIPVSYTHLDVYKRQAFHRMTNHRHFRIYQNGEITGLPGYRDFIVYNKDPDRDLERKKAEIHNQAVSEILKNYEQE